MHARQLVIVLSIVVPLAACGSADDAASTTTSAASTEQSTTLPDGTVAVQLIDVDAQTQSMTLSSKSEPGGTITFEVTNRGNMEHEFLVVQTDLDAADLPFDEAADRVVESEITVVDEIEGVQPGETKTLTVDLSAGHYALICNLVKHWRQGMWANFNVT